MSTALVRELDDSSKRQYAIMFTDVIDFTKMMHEDEYTTIRKIESHRSHLEQLHERFAGRIIQYYGDGSLSIFDQPELAIECAIQIQERVRKMGLPLRIGMHYGEIIEKGEAVYGDGVNLASRIETTAIANSILVSDHLRQALSESSFQFISLGKLQFKNVHRPVEIFSLVTTNLDVPDKKQLEGKLARPKVTGRKRGMVALVAILMAVIAFLWQRNRDLNALIEAEVTTVGVMPPEIEQVPSIDDNIKMGFFENLVTDLSSFYGLQVLSSRATQAYGNMAKSPSDIGRELGVSHLLYSTCRPGNGDSVRINLELVDVRNGRNIWAQSMQREIQDLFTHSIDLSEQLAAFLEARKNPFEVREEKPEVSLRAYRRLSQARLMASERTEEGLFGAIGILQEAIRHDSSFALGYALISQYYSLLHNYHYVSEIDALPKAQEFGGQAFFYDRNLAEAYLSNALMDYSFFLSGPDEILELLQQAVQLRPSYDYAYFLMSRVYYDLQDLQEAENYLTLALKLNPDEVIYQLFQAKLLEEQQDYSKSTNLLQKLLDKYPGRSDLYAYQVKNLVEQEKYRAAQKLITKISEEKNRLWAEAYLALKQQNVAEAGQLLDQLKRKFPSPAHEPLQLLYFDHQEDKAEAWQLMDKAIQERSLWIKEIQHLPLSEKITNQDRYKQILRHAGLVLETDR